MPYTIEPMDPNNPVYHRLVKRDLFGHVLYRSRPMRTHALVDLEDALRVHRLGYAKYDPASTEPQDKVPDSTWRLLQDYTGIWTAYAHANDCVEDRDCWSTGAYKETEDDEWCWPDYGLHRDYFWPWRCRDVTGSRCSTSRAIPADLTCS